MAKEPKQVSAEDTRKAEQDEFRRAREESIKEMDEAVPTPTQEENDQAVLNVAAGKGAEPPAAQPAPEQVIAPAPARASTSDAGSTTYRNRADKSS